MKKSIAIVLGVFLLLAMATPAFAKKHHKRHHHPRHTHHQAS
jgi:hypothetical protein